MLEDDGVNLPRMRKTNNSNIQENYIQKLRKLRFYTAHACAKGLSNWFCLSVSLFVSPVKNEQHTDLLIYSIWSQASKQASTHTHVRNQAVTLVWGSLRLAQITVSTVTYTTLSHQERIRMGDWSKSV